MGLFDFDGDGKTSAWESFLEYSLFEEFANKGTGEKGIGLFADDDDDNWRDDCEDGSAYDIDPWDYDSLEEYEEALEDARLRSSSDGDDNDDDNDDDENDEEADDEEDAEEEEAEDADDDNGEDDYKDDDEDDDDDDEEDDDDDWRDDCEDGFDYDIDPWDYDSREEYEKALKKAKRGRKPNEEDDDGEDNDDDDDDDDEVSWDIEEVEVYTYCQVGVPGILKTYSYLTDDETLEPGDRVVVPFGRDNEERAGTVMSVSRYTAENAPYPVEKTKWILRRLIGGRQDMEEYRITKPTAPKNREHAAAKREKPTDRGESGSPLRRLILWLEQNGRSAEEIVDCLKTVL